MKQILRILEKDARTTPQQISDMTDIPIGEVEDVIKKAESEKVIVKYRTMINWDRIEENRVRALIEVKLQPQRDVGFDAIAERISRFPQAYTVYLVSGQYDLLVIVEGQSMQEVAAFVSQKLAPLESVQGTVTHFLLKCYKEEGEILGDSEKVERLPFVL